MDIWTWNSDHNDLQWNYSSGYGKRFVENLQRIFPFKIDSNVHRRLFSGGEYAIGLLITLRILMGLGAGPTFPSLTVLLAAWVPQKETGKLGTLILGGGQV